MFAIVAAIIFFLVALGVPEGGTVDWFVLGIAFLALHFAWNPIAGGLPTLTKKR